MAYNTLDELFTGICDAVRVKEGTTEPINHQDIPNRISAITTGGWKRPSDWLAIPAFNTSYDEVYILMAIYETDFNPIAFIFSGNYSVDWGDGTTNNYSAGATAERVYNWSSIPDETLTSEGFKQILIRVYCPTGTMTSINFSVKHSASPNTDCTSTILEIEANYVSISNLVIANTLPHKMLTKCGFYGIITMTDFKTIFASCYALKVIASLNTDNATIMRSMFNGCIALEIVPELNTSSVTDMSYMFDSCYKIKTVPLFDTSKCTNFSYMFRFCYNLESVPQFITNLASNMNYMFAYCYNLKIIPLLNTTSVTSMQYMFGYDNALMSIPALNMASISSASNVAYFITNGLGLRDVKIHGVKYAISFANCYGLSATELNTIFTNLGTAVGAQTITITNCAGAATCNRTIATAKGWTVTG